MHKLVVLLLIAGLPQLATCAFTCVAFNRSELVSPCNVYDPSTWGYLDLNATTLADELAYQQGWVSSLQQLISDPVCRPWAVAFSCQAPQVFPRYREALRTCATDDFGSPVEPPTPVPICKDLCDNYLLNCRPYFEQLGVSAVYPPNYCDAFSNAGLTYRGQHVPCYNVTPGDNATAAPPGCPSELLLSPTGVCDVRCPSAEYTEQQVFSVGLMQQIVAWISFVAALALFVVYCCLPELRRFPNRIIVYLLLSTLPLSLAFMLATFVGGDVGRVWCGDTAAFELVRIDGSTSSDPNIRAIASGGLCVAQAWLFVWGTLSSAFWWFVLVLNTTLLIYRSTQFQRASAEQHKLELAYVLFGWCLPTVLTIVPTAADRMDYEATDLFCFIASADTHAWQIAFWFVPMGLTLVAGFVALLLAITMMLRLPTARSRVEKIVSARLVVSLVMQFVTIALVFAYIIFNAAELELNFTEVVQFLVCRVSGGAESVCRQMLNDQSSLTVSYDLGSAASFFVCASGFLQTVFFASTSSFLSVIKKSFSSSADSKDSGSAAKTKRASSHTPREQLEPSKTFDP